jgi:DNA-binding protein Fis
MVPCRKDTLLAWKMLLTDREEITKFMDITPYAVPAVLALLAKGIIYLYAHYSPQRNVETRLYLLFLFALSIQNLAELSAFSDKSLGLLEPNWGKLYFAAGIVALALLAHLALRLAADSPLLGGRAAFYLALYVPAGLLLWLLASGPLLVMGFEPLAYTYTKVPGPLYLLFEIYAVAYFGTSVLLLAYGSAKQDTPSKRLKNKLMLLGALPGFIVVVAVIGLQHYAGFRAFNTTVTLPIAITFFLAVTAYATHQHRLFDIEFYIPRSKVRARKTAFYDRIRAMVAEIADLGSVNQVMNRLADTLHCSAALVGGGRPVLATAGNATQLADFPREELTKIDRILVANEIADSRPETFSVMKRHGVAAIVPFYPHTQTAASWLLLGDSFSEQVYTPLDFKMVEQLFDKMAELFLDKMIVMRTQLADTQRQLRTLDQRLRKTEDNFMAIKEENQLLRRQNAKLVSENMAAQQSSVLGRPVASMNSDDASETRTGAAAEEKTLDEYVSEFEARILEQALKRCDGNKSMAARMLGLRPNTLHYKLERYGLSKTKKPHRGE